MIELQVGCKHCKQKHNSRTKTGRNASVCHRLASHAVARVNGCVFTSHYNKTGSLHHPVASCLINKGVLEVTPPLWPDEHCSFIGVTADVHPLTSSSAVTRVQQKGRLWCWLFTRKHGASVCEDSCVRKVHIYGAMLVWLCSALISTEPLSSHMAHVVSHLAHLTRFLSFLFPVLFLPPNCKQMAKTTFYHTIKPD